MPEKTAGRAVKKEKRPMPCTAHTGYTIGCMACEQERIDVNFVPPFNPLPPLEPMPKAPQAFISEQMFRYPILETDREILLRIERKLDKLIGFFMREEEDAG